ncbi:aromatase/cyclase [Streptomyces sp. NPDC003717]|uniref:aromatase/cyclase n=1 Tax=Streptomyces sp. NPDC003717 TaxID=3154276 RepID=UPI0033AC9248
MDVSTPTRPESEARHVTPLAADAARAYALVEDVTRWPLLFTPCVHAEETERDGESQRIRLWAVVGGDVRSWTSRRRLRPAEHRIDFAQEQPAPPVTAMGGHWRFVSAGEEPGVLELAHHWRTEGPAGTAERIAEALDANSDAEIAALRSWAESPYAPEDLLVRFRDEETVAAPPADVYAFLYEADRWPERLPHVAGLDLETVPADEATAGADVQTMDMETRTADGSAHVTQSIRLCFADERAAGDGVAGYRIVYKQTTPPRGLLAHSGAWIVTVGADGTRVAAEHTVALDPAALDDVFGPGTTLAQAAAVVRERVGGNSRATLRAAREQLTRVGP